MSRLASHSTTHKREHAREVIEISDDSDSDLDPFVGPDINYVLDHASSSHPPPLQSPTKRFTTTKKRVVNLSMGTRPRGDAEPGLTDSAYYMCIKSEGLSGKRRRLLSKVPASVKVELDAVLDTGERNPTRRWSMSPNGSYHWHTQPSPAGASSVSTCYSGHGRVTEARREKLGTRRYPDVESLLKLKSPTGSTRIKQRSSEPYPQPPPARRRTEIEPPAIRWGAWDPLRTLTGDIDTDSGMDRSSLDTRAVRGVVKGKRNMKEIGHGHNSLPTSGYARSDGGVVFLPELDHIPVPPAPAPIAGPAAGPAALALHSRVLHHPSIVRLSLHHLCKLRPRPCLHPNLDLKSSRGANCRRTCLKRMLCRQQLCRPVRTRIHHLP
ncbi:hypothetical protein D9619_011113 [Psilocybe cf. subviscida]|uniref:Uncharacterized protein n=1 Tax=Psilocybe cf. subviscida TaxID=2480587 RepID=A0A8H5BJ93_9AGAR|nr:hypothetical protein D9619_011113 [Psilocybe cf. subviscida]